MTAATEQRPLGYEANGINVSGEDERKGLPRGLFWPWFAANISVLGLAYGAYVLEGGVSFWQACLAGFIGIVVSFLLVGFIAVAGKRGSAPTLVLSRAAFGVQGNKLPALVSWILNVGWEIVLTVLATLATATVFAQLHWSAGTATKVIAFLIVTVLIVGSAALGFDTIMRLQTVITWVTGVLTVVYLILVAGKIHWATVSAIPSGSAQQVLGVTVLVATGFGLGWVNVGADYSRYLPRRSSGAGVVWWTTFGASIAPLFLLTFGLLLAGSVYVVFFASDFVVQFEGFLITLGVPIAAWCGIMLADILLRRSAYSDADLFSSSGRYGSVRWVPAILLVASTVIGWGLVTNSYASWLSWQGYLLGPFGLGGKTGTWAFANLGVIVALVIAFVGWLAFGRAAIRRQEAAPAAVETVAAG